MKYRRAHSAGTDEKVIPRYEASLRKYMKETARFSFNCFRQSHRGLIRETVQAGADAISRTTPPTAGLFREPMAAYREAKPHP